MKKLISIILTTVFVFSSLCTSTLAFGDDSEYLYKQCFDSEKTNAVPTGITALGSSSARVVDDGRANKAFYVNTGNLDNNITMNLASVASQYVLSFQLKRVGKVFPLEIVLQDEAGAKMQLLKSDKDGALRLNDGKVIGGIGQNQYTKISLVADGKNNFYSVYVGDSSAYKWPLTQKLSGALSLSLTTVAPDAESGLYIDNILLYSGTKVRTAKPSSSYNPASIEYFEEDETNRLQRVYVKQDFENPETESEGLKIVPKTNILEVREEGDNRFLYFEQIDPTIDFQVDISLGATSSSVVWEMDVKIDTPGMEVALMRVYDSVSNSSQISTNLSSFNNGRLSGNLGIMSPGRWYNIAAVVNLTTCTYDLYMDGTKAIESQKLHATLPFRTLSHLRIACSPNKSGDMSIDNIRIYDGKEPRDISNEERVSENVFANDSLAENFLKTKTAFNPYMGIVYAGGEKKRLEVMPVINGDDIYITKDVAADFLPDINSFEKAKKMTQNGNDMYLLSDLIKLSKRYVYDDLHGLFISADNSFEANAATLEAAHRRASFLRPESEEIKNDIIKANGENTTRHPRLFADAEDFARLKSEVRTDVRKKGWYESILVDTEAIMTAPVSVYEKADGLRILSIAAEAETRMTNLGFCWQMTGDRKYFDRAWKEFEALLAFPDWNAQDHFLDTATMATAFAIGYDWFYDAFTPEQRQLIYDCSLKNALIPHNKEMHGELGGGGASGYAKNKTNWSATCNAGIINLALVVAEHDIDYCAEMISSALKSLEYMWYYFAPDGAWHEGTNYWGATLGDSVMAVASLDSAIGTDYNMSRYKGMDKLVFFVPIMAGTSGQLYNFHDSGTEYRSVPAMFWMADKFDNPAMAILRLQFMEKYKNISANKPSVMDIIWCESGFDASGEVPLDNDWYYKGTELIAMRSSYSKPDASFLAYHGGLTYGAHEHMDAGSFVYDIDGTRWAMDLGSDIATYNVNFAFRNNYYRVRGEGHNIVVINPSEDDAQDKDGFAPITRYEVSEKSAISVIDLSSCYKETTSSYQRGFYFTNDRRVLTVRDEINLTDEAEMYWFMHTSAMPEIVDNNTAILTLGDKQLKVEFVLDADSYELSVMDARPLPTSPDPAEQLRNAGIRKLALKIKDKGITTITAKLSMLDEPYSALPVNTASISDWTLDDGMVYEKPLGEAALSSITIDGKSIGEYNFKAFDPSQKSYDLIIVGDGKTPEVTATSDDGTVEVVNSKFADGKPYTLIKIPQENGFYTPYIIRYNMVSEAELSVGEYKRHIVYNSMSSAVPEPENGVTNSYDGSLGTRWSTVSGDYMVHDLGTTRKIDAFAAAFMNGTKRLTMFDILVSEDGENYTLVYSGASSGTTDELEIFEIKEPVNARYVKFLGHGNSDSHWTSITEFYALERK